MSDPRPAVDPAAIDRLLEMTGGDRDFLVDLMDTFIEDGSRQLDALSAAVEMADTDAAVRPAHSLKSNSASMGAERLADMCRALEADARAGTIDDGPARVGAAQNEFWLVRIALESLRDGS
jgi:HPt (histidine-containing phosphotransfer) domain-containing protein